MILFCKLVCAYEHKICENKFGGCKKSFSVFEFKATEYSYSYSYSIRYSIHSSDLM